MDLVNKSGKYNQKFEGFTGKLIFLFSNTFWDWIVYKFRQRSKLDFFFLFWQVVVTL